MRNRWPTFLFAALLAAEWKGSAAVPVDYRPELEKLGARLEVQLSPRR